MVHASPPRKSLLLLLWLCLGGLLRLYGLSRKPPWTDEFATVLYGRGDDYGAIAINKILSAADLLAPLKGYPVHGLQRVSELLIQQNNHPPLYFFLVNCWQRLFPLDEAGYISINAVRLLSVVLGIISIFLMYWMAKKRFSQKLLPKLVLP